MVWNWQRGDWPAFTYNASLLTPLEAQFLHGAGILVGMVTHLDESEKEYLKVALISDEALKTSEIEGEILNRDSVQASIQQQFGLRQDLLKATPAEKGIAEMMVELYRSYQVPLDHQTLFSWHRMLTNGRRDIRDIGCYRTHPEPMQVVSGVLSKPKVHFEAPPSVAMGQEMDRFVNWFNQTAPDGGNPLSPLTRAGIAHLYFVSIHPFEDGNGRIGRAVAEKALAQCLGQPTLLALSTTIEKHRKAYYQALEQANKHNEISEWLVYFSNTLIEAQGNTQAQVAFLIAKAQLYDRLRGRLNSRQEIALERMFLEGIDGFKGGLSADNYIRITKASPATATRDLHDLVEKGALTRTGERKHTRYALKLPT